MGSGIVVERALSEDIGALRWGTRAARPLHIQPPMAPTSTHPRARSSSVPRALCGSLGPLGTTLQTHSAGFYPQLSGSSTRKPHAAKFVNRVNVANSALHGTA